MAKPLKDVAEMDVIEEQLANSEYVDEESRKIAIEARRESTKSPVSAAWAGNSNMSDPALGLLMLGLISSSS